METKEPPTDDRHLIRPFRRATHRNRIPFFARGNIDSDFLDHETNVTVTVTVTVTSGPLAAKKFR
jgi:hypothetical protein